MEAKMLYSRMPDIIHKRLTRRYYDPGNPIIMAGQENNYVFFLVDGEAEASIQNSDGSFATVYLYKTNSIFGELEPFYSDFHPVSIIATKRCVTEALSQRDFLEWLENDFESTKLLIRIIAEKLVRNSHLISEVSLLSVRERVLRCIAISNYDNKLSTLTKQQLSIEANAPIRSVNRAVAECTKLGLITYKNKQFYIINPSVVMDYLPPMLK